MDKIEVSQRARDAVADYSIKWTGLDEQAANRIKDGLHDPYSLVQAFARFERDILVTRTDATPVATDVAALVEAAKDLRDAIAHMAAPARVDPDKYFSEQVKAFGDAFGYGALMTTASALWRQSLGDLQGGEFAVGPCVTTAANQLNRLSAALAPFTKGQP